MSIVPLCQPVVGKQPNFTSNVKVMRKTRRFASRFADAIVVAPLTQYIPGYFTELLKVNRRIPIWGGWGTYPLAEHGLYSNTGWDKYIDKLKMISEACGTNTITMWTESILAPEWHTLNVALLVKLMEDAFAGSGLRVCGEQMCHHWWLAKSTQLVTALCESNLDVFFIGGLGNKLAAADPKAIQAKKWEAEECERHGRTLYHIREVRNEYLEYHYSPAEFAYEVKTSTGVNFAYWSGWEAQQEVSAALSTMLEKSNYIEQINEHDDPDSEEFD